MEDASQIGSYSSEHDLFALPTTEAPHANHPRPTAQSIQPRPSRKPDGVCVVLSGDSQVDSLWVGRVLDRILRNARLSGISIHSSYKACSSTYRLQLLLQNLPCAVDPSFDGLRTATGQGGNIRVAHPFIDEERHGFP